MRLKHRAFTMIELMVVISVIMILTAFTIYSMGPARAKSRDSRRITDANLIMTSLDQYYTSNLRTYPTPSGVDSADTQYHAVVIAASSLSISSYINPIPVDPINDTDHRYVYVYRGDGKKAAVVVDAFESMTNRCNIPDVPEADLPDSVRAYKKGVNLIVETVGDDISSNPNACYYVAR